MAPPPPENGLDVDVNVIGGVDLARWRTKSSSRQSQLGNRPVMIMDEQNVPVGILRLQAPPIPGYCHGSMSGRDGSEVGVNGSRSRGVEEKI